MATRSNPKPSEIWVHCKGAEYEIIGIGTCVDTERDVVVYKNKSGEIYTRSVSVFMGRHDNGSIRFEKKA